MTSTSTLDYPLQNGFIHNWLVAGPHATPVSDLERFQGGLKRLRQLPQSATAPSDQAGQERLRKEALFSFLLSQNLG